MHLRTGQAEVPVPREGLRRWQRDVPEVDGADRERDVAADDHDGQPRGNGVLDCERDDRDGHQQFVGHGVDDGADDSGLIVAAGEVAVDRVGDAGVEEEGEGEGGLRGEDGVADGWGGDEACEG